jgi:hypothetical protein
LFLKFLKIPENSSKFLKKSRNFGKIPEIPFFIIEIRFFFKVPEIVPRILETQKKN